MMYANTARRPTSLAEMVELVKLDRTEESLRHGLSFQPKATDVLISAYSKSGTTWLQQIVHGLRTRGDMDFGEITEVVPFLERALDFGLDLHAPQKAEPRAFKCHLSWNDVPKGGRYIVPFRDPKDVLVSMYRFMEGWFFEPGSISISAYARERFMRFQGSGRYWSHLASWWEHRFDPNVLLLCFEDMKEDLSQAVRTVARFIDCELDKLLLDLVVRQSSIEFMRAHIHKFDENLNRVRSEKVCGLPPGGDSSKVKNGQVGGHVHVLSESISQELDDIWREEIESKFGFVSYQAFREALLLHHRNSDNRSSRLDRA